MPRVTHVKKARKDVPGTDIKAGESYYWWKFRYGGKHASRTPPKASQLTQSEYLSQMYAFEENYTLASDKDDAAQDFRSLAEEVRALGEEQADKRSNMPDSLQDSETGELLQSRADRCEEIATALEEAADELDAFEPEEPEEPEDGEGEDTEDKELAAEDEADAQWIEKADELWGAIDWSPE